MVEASKMINIDWVNFTPVSATLGGTMIGTAAAVMLYTTGRIAGISGIVGGLLKPTSSGEKAWRGAFTGGLIAGGALVHLLMSSQPLPQVSLDNLSLVAAGMLVGFGTRLGNGCTSGHGVCGLSRFSGRSLMATLTFMATGILSAIVSPSLSPIARILVACGCVGPAAALLRSRKAGSSASPPSEVSSMHTLSCGASGLVFGAGLAVSGMTDPEKVTAFLRINSFWDPSLMFVMGSAVVLGSLTFKFILPKGTKDNVTRMPLFGRKWYVVNRNDIDLKLLAGASIFGLGWGLAGMCPGPALVVSALSVKGAVFSASMLSAMALFNFVS